MLMFPHKLGGAFLVTTASVNAGMEPRKQTVPARQLLSRYIPSKVSNNNLIIACCCLQVLYSNHELYHMT